jgi:hypothetical protein
LDISANVNSEELSDTKARLCSLHLGLVCEIGFEEFSRKIRGPSSRHSDRRPSIGDESISGRASDPLRSAGDDDKSFHDDDLFFASA